MEDRFRIAGPWISDGYFAYRLFLDQNGVPLKNIPRNRACTITKTPRININVSYVYLPDGIDSPIIRPNHETGQIILGEGYVLLKEGPKRVSFSDLKDDMSWWLAGPKGSGIECGDYQPSRDWCDQMLKRFNVWLKR